MKQSDQLLEDYEDAFFAILMNEVAMQEGERYEKLNQELCEDSSFEIPQTTNQRCLQTINRYFNRYRRRTALRSVARIFHFVSIIIVVSTLIFTAAFAISEDFRVVTRNLLIAVNEQYTDFRMKTGISSDNTSEANISGQSSNSEDIEKYFEHFVVGWIPEGFHLVRNEYDAWAHFENDEGEWIQILFADDTTAVQLDTEGADVSNSNISGLPAVIVEKNGRNSVLLIDETSGFFYLVITSSGVDLETSIEIAAKLIF